jgi:hypothetical protein
VGDFLFTVGILCLIFWIVFLPMLVIALIKYQIQRIWEFLSTKKGRHTAFRGLVAVVSISALYAIIILVLWKA